MSGTHDLAVADIVEIVVDVVGGRSREEAREVLRADRAAREREQAG